TDGLYHLGRLAWAERSDRSRSLWHGCCSPAQSFAVGCGGVSICLHSWPARVLAGLDEIPRFLRVFRGVAAVMAGNCWGRQGPANRPPHLLNHWHTKCSLFSFDEKKHPLGPTANEEAMKPSLEEGLTSE